MTMCQPTPSAIPPTGLVAPHTPHHASIVPTSELGGGVLFPIVHHQGHGVRYCSGRPCSATGDFYRLLALHDWSDESAPIGKGGLGDCSLGGGLQTTGSGTASTRLRELYPCWANPQRRGREDFTGKHDEDAPSRDDARLYVLSESAIVLVHVARNAASDGRVTLAGAAWWHQKWPSPAPTPAPAPAPARNAAAQPARIFWPRSAFDAASAGAPARAFLRRPRQDAWRRDYCKPQTAVVSL
ncbi:uncharacterized protein B0I36DRAFT_352045 [Microdochium trichocladiopsis]|uniref:Uncharacterized protein n=1 Tax=Microdochium trichocladiopsis TaxID=1682393 RepID=A0A9P9BQR2_9PEZI|nr:uncharacterized protein B0I36DRAFT_352045 [Microdochium trichocladiopsis]KAH7026142.1 hypothetical protein B0I36DRAFT_352045 [Microdochium trichocladiopsis]